MPRVKKAPSGMPVVSDAGGSERERLAAWFKEKMEQVEAEHQERIELLRTVGEHPSPIIARLVRKFAGLVAKTQIAKLLDMPYSTLMAYYADDVELGAAQMNVMVATNMARIATSPTDPQASKVGMDWLERRGGDEWRRGAQKIEIDSKNTQPPIIDSSKLTREERDQMRIMLTRIAEGGEGEPLGPDEEDDPVIS